MAQGMIVVAEGSVTLRETKLGAKSGKPYSVCEIGWVGGSSGFFFVRDEELARIPPIGTHCRVTFEAKAGKDGIRASKLLNVESAQASQTDHSQQSGAPPIAGERVRRAA